MHQSAGFKQRRLKIMILRRSPLKSVNPTSYRSTILWSKSTLKTPYFTIIVSSMHACGFLWTIWVPFICSRKVILGLPLKNTLSILNLSITHLFIWLIMRYKDSPLTTEILKRETKSAINSSKNIWKKSVEAMSLSRKFWRSSKKLLKLLSNLAYQN